jgi:hypothetical protein
LPVAAPACSLDSNSRPVSCEILFEVGHVTHLEDAFERNSAPGQTAQGARVPAESKAREATDWQPGNQQEGRQFLIHQGQIGGHTHLLAILH